MKKREKSYCNPLPLPDYPIGFCALKRKPYGWLNNGDIKDFRETADPSVLYEDGKWYLYPSDGMAWISEDFASWKHIPVEVEGLGYAPCIVKHREVFYLTACDSPLYRSNTPLGPWEKMGKIVDQDGNDLPFQMGDPMLFSDDDSRLYLYFGLSGPGIFGMELDPENPRHGISSIQLLFSFNPEHKWERMGEFNEDTSQSFCEGANMFKTGGRYYLTYAAPGTEYGSYATGCYIGNHPLGPFSYQKNNPVLAQNNGLVRGAGHGCIVRGPNETIWAFYTSVVCRDHFFERRIGCDQGWIDENGELRFHPASQIPQQIPGSNLHPEDGCDIGLLPVSVSKFSRASSQLPARGTSCAIDNNIRTWWEASPEDPSPWFEVNFKALFDISAMRIIWAEPNLDHLANPPGAWQYVAEARENEKTEWKTIIDATDNQTDLLIDYRIFEQVRAQFVRVRILGGPNGMARGITELTVFGRGLPVPGSAPYGKWPPTTV